MKAKELLNNALKMLGYTNADGNAELTGRIRNSAIVTVNLVYSDLWRICNSLNGKYLSSQSAGADSSPWDKQGEPLGDFKPIASLDDEILLPKKATDECFLYGLAMHIARSENDGDQQQYFAHLYNAKRAGLTGYDTVRNTWPHPDC